MKVVVWNMAHDVRNWRALASWPETADADIALLSEAPRPPDGVEALGLWSTEGLDAWPEVEHPVIRRWSTAIASTHRAARIEDARRSRYNPEVRLPFRPSRPGTWEAAMIDLGGPKVTAVALYGLLDERSDASVHRSLSELSPLFDSEMYGRSLLLGGDLNILANPGVDDPARGRHLAVLERIAAYGLVDCLDRALPKRIDRANGLEGCPCGLGKDCRHTWTKRVRGQAIPYQDDYLFASRGLAERLIDCYAMPFTDVFPSDHAPIVATFDV